MMNEKLLKLAKEAGFDSSLGEITVIHMNRHINVTNQVKNLIELVQANSAPDAEAKLKIAVRALKDLLGDTQHKDHVCNTKYCPVAQAKQALEKIGE